MIKILTGNGNSSFLEREAEKGQSPRQSTNRTRSPCSLVLDEKNIMVNPLTINFERKSEGNSVKIGKPPISTNASEAKLGIIGEEYRITVRPGTRSQICRQRMIAFALQDEVERQLRDLEHKGES